MEVLVVGSRKEGFGAESVESVGFEQVGLLWFVEPIADRLIVESGEN